MLFSRSIPKKADIFTQSKSAGSYRSYYKPFNKIKIFSLIIGTFILLFGVAVFLVPGQQVSNAARAMIACPLQPNNGNGNGCNNQWWNNQNQNWNGNDSDNDGDIDTNGDENVNVTPVNFTPNNFTVNTTPFTPIQTQIPAVEPISTSNTLITNTNQPNGGNISGISQQLIAIQQQIGGQMQACVNNANKAAQQIVSLMNQQKQLQAQIDALNNQANNIDTSTPAGQNKQNAINQRIQQLQQQSDNLGNAISNAQDNMNNANSQCQDNVSNLEQNRGTLEGNLDDAFNNAMNIQLPSD
jgi:hypothetical protein